MNESLVGLSGRKLIAKIKKKPKIYTKYLWYFKYGQRRCHYCGVQLVWGNDCFKNEATFDHIIPKSDGGSLHFSNGLIVCRCCNETRKNTNFLVFIRKHDLPKQEWLEQKYVKALLHMKSVKLEVFSKNKKLQRDLSLLTEA